MFQTSGALEKHGAIVNLDDVNSTCIYKMYIKRDGMTAHKSIPAGTSSQSPQKCIKYFMMETCKIIVMYDIYGITIFFSRCLSYVS